MMDYQANLYDPIYFVLGVSATVASAGGQSATVTAVDKTAGLVVTDSRTQIDTIRPAACVRKRELESAGILVADLPTGSITLNGATWTIKSYRTRPSPLGELDGEIMLLLNDEG